MTWGSAQACLLHHLAWHQHCPSPGCLETNPCPDPDKEQTQATTKKGAFQASASQQPGHHRATPNTITATPRQLESMPRQTCPAQVWPGQRRLPFARKPQIKAHISQIHVLELLQLYRYQACVLMKQEKGLVDTNVDADRRMLRH